MEKRKKKKNQKHFVLVHSLCHDAWSWYKVRTQLENAGHCVTAMDLASSGINMDRVENIQTLTDYSKPLLEIMESLGLDEKVILVAHSMGGVPAALAADIFPRKIAAIVFLTSSMPDTKNPPAYVFQKIMSSIPPEEFLDTVFGSYGTPDRPLQSVLFGAEFMAKKLYQMSPVEDLELAKTLVRVNPLAEANQLWMIKNFPPKEVMEIKDADHMAMNSKPQELCARLLELADRYA